MPHFAYTGDIKNVECAICLEPWTDAVEVTPCRHVFCRRCVAKVTTCPDCRAQIQKLSPANRILVNLANEAKCRCETCGWSGIHENRAAHTCGAGGNAAAAPSGQPGYGAPDLSQAQLDAMFGAGAGGAPNAPPPVPAQAPNGPGYPINNTHPMAQPPAYPPPHPQGVAPPVAGYAPPPQQQQSSGNFGGGYPPSGAYPPQQPCAPGAYPPPQQPQPSGHYPPQASGAYPPPPGPGAYPPQGGYPQQQQHPGGYSGGAYGSAAPTGTWSEYGLKQEEYDHIMAIFMTFDEDGSGELDRGELTTLCRWLNFANTPEQIEAMFREMDTDRSGSLSLHEFCQWSSTHRPDPSRLYGLAEDEYHHVLFQFHQFDDDNNGYLDMQEFTGLALRVGYARTRPEAQMVFREIDTDRSGTVDVHELLTYRARKSGHYVPPPQQQQQQMRGAAAPAYGSRPPPQPGQYNYQQGGGGAPQVRMAPTQNRARQHADPANMAGRGNNGNRSRGQSQKKDDCVVQ